MRTFYSFSRLMRFRPLPRLFQTQSSLGERILPVSSIHHGYATDRPYCSLCGGSSALDRDAPSLTMVYNDWRQPTSYSYTPAAPVNRNHRQAYGLCEEVKSMF